MDSEDLYKLRTKRNLIVSHVRFGDIKNKLIQEKILSVSDVRDIESHNQSQMVMMERFMDVLENRGPRAYQVFYESLQSHAWIQTELDGVVDSGLQTSESRGEMTPESQERLTRNRTDLIRKIRIDDILNDFIESGTLNSRDRGRINNEQNEDKKIEMLLDILPYRGEAAYWAFRHSLLSAYPWLVKALDDTTTNVVEGACGTSVEK